jgi:hypothetical protein
VLTLRSEGRSFSAIAGRLGLKRSRDAYQAFHRALNDRPDTERPALVGQELGRLQALEARIRDRDAADVVKMNHRLEALEHMRQDLH